jgi:alpha-galactosidase
MREGIRIYAGPDHWNDPDMMEVGNGMSVSEDRAHFSMWCMLAAPLIAGNDPRSVSQATREILTNKEAIAVDQDELGIQGFKCLKLDDLEVWAKPLKNNELAICFLNRGKETRSFDFDWEKQIIEDNFSQHYYDFQQKEYKVRDLWLRKDLGTTKKPLSVELGAHDVIMLRLSPK